MHRARTDHDAPPEAGAPPARSTRARGTAASARAACGHDRCGNCGLAGNVYEGLLVDGRGGALRIYGSGTEGGLGG